MNTSVLKFELTAVSYADLIERSKVIWQRFTNGRAGPLPIDRMYVETSAKVSRDANNNVHVTSFYASVIIQYRTDLLGDNS